jgi:cysteinyl-tRNA synthetase
VGLTTIIDNAVGGTIRGGTGSSDNAIFASLGSLSINNHGMIAGDIVSDTGTAVENDTVFNSGKIAGKVLLGNGNDAFTGTGGTSGAVFGDGGNDRLVGGSAADKLNGGFGSDRLIGAAGNDKLDGGSGSDTLTGGSGADQFIFDIRLPVLAGFSPTPLNAALNVDRITDFTVNVDKIVLVDVFTDLGPHGTLAASRFHIGTAAADASDRIIYNPTNGFLFYDQDGTGQFHSALQFATVAAHLDLDHADFLVIG